jgi:CHAD domain-containing protein
MSVYQKQISSLFTKATRQIAKTASKPLPRNVHRLRTAIRRVEAVLLELSPELDRNQRKLLKLLTRLRRRAGKVRDIDVQITALRALKVSDAPGRKRRMLDALADLRVIREKKFRKALNSATVEEIRKRLNRIDCEQLIENAPNPLMLASRIFDRVTRENQTLNEASLHQHRINGKRARYIAELAGDAPEAQRFVAYLKQMQDVLGEWHDWLTLSNTVARLTDSGENSPLVSALRNITRAKFREALQAVAATRLALAPRMAASKRVIAATVAPKSVSVETQATAAVA